MFFFCMLLLHAIFFHIARSTNVIAQRGCPSIAIQKLFFFFNFARVLWKHHAHCSHFQYSVFLLIPMLFIGGSNVPTNQNPSTNANNYAGKTAKRTNWQGPPFQNKFLEFASVKIQRANGFHILGRKVRHICLFYLAQLLLGRRLCFG